MNGIVIQNWNTLFYLCMELYIIQYKRLCFKHTLVEDGFTAQKLAELICQELPY